MVISMGSFLQRVTTKLWHAYVRFSDHVCKNREGLGNTCTFDLTGNGYVWVNPTVTDFRTIMVGDERRNTDFKKYAECSERE